MTKIPNLPDQDQIVNFSQHPSSSKVQKINQNFGSGDLEI